MNNINTRKKLFWGILGVSYILIFLFNFLTPYLTDDLFFMYEMKGDESFGNIWRLQVIQYMTQNGRFITEFLLRCLLKYPKLLFDVLNSGVYVFLSLLIYDNVRHKKAYDIRLLTGITVMMWITLVDFHQTILWETGALVYLWGTVFTLGFVTLYRRMIEKETVSGTANGKRAILVAACMFLLGVLGGWDNENTSGGGVMLTVFFLAEYMGIVAKDGLHFKGVLQANKGKIKPYMITGLLGQLVGLACLVLAPGVSKRAVYMEEEHTGLYAYVARFQKITLVIQEELLLIMLICVVLYILCRYQKKTKWELRYPIWFMITAVATCYALIMIAPTQHRAYFGAGIFVLIVMAQLYTDLAQNDALVQTFKMASVVCLVICFFFIYMDHGANMARVYRESKERWDYLEEHLSMGNPAEKTVYVAKLRPEFENPYTEAYDSDMTEDPAYWVNQAYSSYFGFKEVIALPREEWEEIR